VDLKVPFFTKGLETFQKAFKALEFPPLDEMLLKDKERFFRFSFRLSSPDPVGQRLHPVVAT